MTDAVDKVIAIAARAQHKKADQWTAVKMQAPDLAHLLMEVRRLFGRPRGVRVTVDGKTLIDTLPKNNLLFCK